jgi:hypothetical protein
MEKQTLNLASEAVGHIEIRRFKAERKKLEAIPPPKKKDESGWVGAEEKKIYEEMASIARSVELKGFKDVESMYSPELHDQHSDIAFSKNVQNELLPFLKLQYLSYRKTAKEEIRYQREMDAYNRRFENIDGSIRSWEAKIPKPFSPELINIDKRFSISRCRELQGRYYDVWLSDGLKEKPIFFDSPNYIEKLIQFYNEVYLPLHEKEQKGEDVVLSNGAMRAGGVA